MALRFRKPLILTLCWILWAIQGAGYAQPTSVPEYRVKAAFLYNFAKFIAWPESDARDPSEPFVIGILGQDPFGPEIRDIEGKTVKGSRLVVRYLREVREAKDCRVVFISASLKERLSAILRHLHGLPVLTVSDAKGFAGKGVMVNLTNEENKIRFEINTSAAGAAGLKISSHLLRLARIVEQGKS